MTDDELRAICDNHVEDPLGFVRNLSRGCLSLLAERDKLKEEVEQWKTELAACGAMGQEIEANHQALERVADDCQARNTQLKAKLQAARKAAGKAYHIVSFPSRSKAGAFPPTLDTPSDEQARTEYYTALLVEAGDALEAVFEDKD